MASGKVIQLNEQLISWLRFCFLLILLLRALSLAFGANGEERVEYTPANDARLGVNNAVFTTALQTGGVLVLK